MPVRKRGDYYHIRLQINGQRYSQSCKGATYEQAKALEAKIRQDIINESLGQASYTLEDALARWLEGEATSLKSYQKIVQTVAIIRPHITDTPIIKAQDAAQRIREAYRDLDPATVNRRLAIVRRVVNLSWEWGWIKSPIKISMQPGENARHVYKSVAEVIRLAKHARRSKWHLILAAFSAMRQGEILRIQPKDVIDGAVYLGKTKNGKPRLVPLNKVAQCAIERLDWGVTYPILRHDFEHAREACKMDIRFHDLRHTGASFMVKGGASMTAIRDVMGHSNLSVTSRYSHLGIDDLKKAVDKMTSGTKTAQKSKVKRVA
jgi:integrase